MKNEGCRNEHGMKLIREMLREENLSFFDGENEVFLYLPGDERRSRDAEGMQAGYTEMTVSAMEDGMVFAARPSICMPPMEEEDMDEALSFIMEENYGNVCGGLVMDEESGDLSFRTYVSFGKNGRGVSIREMLAIMETTRVGLVRGMGRVMENLKKSRCSRMEKTEEHGGEADEDKMFEELCRLLDEALETDAMKCEEEEEEEEEETDEDEEDA